MAQTTVVVKYPDEDRYVQIDFTPYLQAGEQINTAVLGVASPSGLIYVLNNYATPMVNMTIGAGQDGTSYGFSVTVTTNAPRTIVKNVAVVCNSSLAYQYKVTNPDAFNTLVSSLDAGEAAIGNATFNFPTSVDPTGGYVTWELIDQEGTIYASGNCFTYVVTNNGVTNRVDAQAIINAPSEIPTTLVGQKYQIRWSLLLPGTSTPVYNFESVSINCLTTIPIGTEDVVDLAGKVISLGLVTHAPFEKVGYTVYWQNNEALPYTQVIDKTRTADGWQYRGAFDTAQAGLWASLTPYTVIWEYSNSRTSYTPERDTARMFLINPSLMSAVDDMRAMVQKSMATIANQPDILFTIPLLLAYLRRGRDHFNGAYGMLTSFDMSNASGSVREYWIRCSEVMALRAQFLAEGEKVFNFSGQSITLDSDRTSYYQSMASDIQSGLDQELKVYKMNLIKKGILGGDGNVDNVSARPGSAGAIGLTLTPASNFGKLTGFFNGGRVI